jgi:hypothetical protein
MTRLGKIPLFFVLACAGAIPCVAQCGFVVEPASQAGWFREEGWLLPGLKDTKEIKPFHLRADAYPKAWPDGITASLLMHEDGYQVRFPEAIFDDKGARKRMSPVTFNLIQLVRWRYHGTIYAYTYSLWPQNSACGAGAIIIDNRGDGKFRLMIPTMLSKDDNPGPPPVPEWLNRPKS